MQKHVRFSLKEKQKADIITIKVIVKASKLPLIPF